MIGIGALIAGWFIYDLLCESALGKHPALLGLTLFVLIVFAAWGFSQVFSGRAAYIHTGALIGTIMVGNVFRTIMPAQRALVAAIEQNREPDPALPAKGLLRSRHNNYFTLPVLFIMISNHFPSTYGNHYNWLILAAISVLAVLVRHYFNTRHATGKFAWALPLAALGMISLAFVTSGKFSTPATAPVAPPATTQQAPAMSEFDKVSGVIHERCTVCHSAQPTSPLFSAAPAGVMFDTPQQIQQMAPRIQAQAVASQIMPLGNITQMTQQERDLIGAWIANGAKTGN